jgi:hypothetical protein
MKRCIASGGIALALGLFCFGADAESTAAAEFPPIFEPELSLTGSCGESAIDPVKDPGCPYPPPPGGPSGGFAEPRSIAIDAYGNEYVASYAGDGTKGRIDVFDDEGFFITELLDPQGPFNVAVDSKGNLYAFEFPPARVARYEPSVYKPSTGEIKYENPRVVVATAEGGGVRIALDPKNDHLIVNENNAIKIYDSAVAGNKLLDTITHPKLHASLWTAVDGQRRRLYATYCKESIFKCGVLVFEADSPYNLLEEIDGSMTPAGKFVSNKGWLSIAVNEESGHFFVDDLEASQRIYEFDENFEYASKLEHESFAGGNALQIAVSNSPQNPTARNLHYLFVPVLFPTPGRVLAFKPPAILPPKVESLEVINISETDAELKATIDPNGGDTEYVIEIEGPGFGSAEIVAQGTISGPSPPKTVSSLVGSLEPGATYDIRAFAKNEADDDEEKTSFSTYSDAVTSGSCSNQTLRAGSSAALPDCRAYELVTPADTNGRPPVDSQSGDRFAMVRSSPTGDIVSFDVSGGVLPGTEGTGGFHGDPYRATRSASGWKTVLVGPTGSEASQEQPGSFSPDQGYSFFVAAREGSAVIGGHETHYVRYPDGHKELVGRGSLGTDPQAMGTLITEGGAHIVFQTFSFPSFPAIQLESSAPPTGVNAVYDRTSDEVTHVVSLLPGDVIPVKDSKYRGASADGSGIAFENESTLYLRLNNATTFQIGSKGAEFAGVSDEGKRVFYVEGGDLLAFDTESEEVVEFTATGDAVPVKVAPNGARAYFVSEEAIGGSGPNPNGAEPQTGEQNLYRSDEGAVSFVAAVTERDVKGLFVNGVNYDGLGLWTEALVWRAPGLATSRLTPDGEILLFQSRANLDGYDSGEFAQVYRYDSTAEELDCLSCPPTKLPATGGAALQSFSVLDLTAPFAQTSFVPNLRADGKRAFFESTEALVSSDTDEVRDVYEWEEEGVGSCTREGGCVYLISSGHSARNNYLFGHSASGDDVFFTTGDVLVGGDEDTVSVYDARVNGGFAEEVPRICIEEACKPPATPPPALSTPPKTVIGVGNATPRKRCPKGKRKVVRKGRTVCIKKKRHHKQRKAQKQ